MFLFVVLLLPQWFPVSAVCLRKYAGMISPRAKLMPGNAELRTDLYWHRDHRQFGGLDLALWTRRTLLVSWAEEDGKDALVSDSEGDLECALTMHPLDRTRRLQGGRSYGARGACVRALVTGAWQTHEWRTSSTPKRLPMSGCWMGGLTTPPSRP